jgi:hypothetical protein
LGFDAQVSAFETVAAAELEPRQWATAIDEVSQSRGSAAAMFNVVLASLALYAPERSRTLTLTVTERGACC